MDFIIRLPLLIEGFNIIPTIVNKLFKERYYIPYIAGEERTLIKKIIKLLLR
jgi:hypothetical protein